MTVGFTGTQIGMSSKQKEHLRSQLIALGAEWFRHGDCIGADSEAHTIAMSVGCRIAIHPPIDSKKRAFREGDYLAEPKDYLVRNHDIVDESQVLIAAPKNERREERISGTWATIRYARKIGRRVIILPRV
jgi:hypothetical protein